MSEGKNSWKKRIAMLGAGLGLAGLVGKGIDRSPKGEGMDQKPTPAEVERDTRTEDEDARRAVDSHVREQKSREEDEESVAKVKAGIDAMFQPKEVDKDDVLERNDEPMGENHFRALIEALHNFSDITFDNDDYSRPDLYYKDSNGEKYFLATIERLKDDTYRVSPQIEGSKDYIFGDIGQIKNFIPQIRDKYVKERLENERKFRNK